MDGCTVLGKIRSQGQIHGHSKYGQKGKGIVDRGFLLNSVELILKCFGRLIALYVNLLTIEKQTATFKCIVWSEDRSVWTANNVVQMTHITLQNILNWLTPASFHGHGKAVTGTHPKALQLYRCVNVWKSKHCLCLYAVLIYIRLFTIKIAFMYTISTVCFWKNFVCV